MSIDVGEWINDEEIHPSNDGRDAETPRRGKKETPPRLNTRNRKNDIKRILIEEVNFIVTRPSSKDCPQK